MWLLNMLLRPQGYINGIIVSIKLKVIVFLYLKLVRASPRFCFTLVAAFEENGDVLLLKSRLKKGFCVTHFL